MGGGEVWGLATPTPAEVALGRAPWPHLSLASSHSPVQDASEYVGQDTCGANSWNLVDVELPLSHDQEPGVTLQNLKPWTQYAIAVRAISLTTAEERRNFGAQSEVVFVRTLPAGEGPGAPCPPTPGESLSSNSPPPQQAAFSGSWKDKRVSHAGSPPLMAAMELCC